jgi:hypothetical protein
VLLLPLLHSTNLLCYDSLLVQVGDETMSVLEIWGAEYQENDCLLIKPESRALLEAVCERERCLMQVSRLLLLIIKGSAAMFPAM